MRLLENERGMATASALLILTFVGFLSAAIFILVQKEIALAEHDALLFDLQNEAESSLVLATARLHTNNEIFSKLTGTPKKPVFLFEHHNDPLGIICKIYGKKDGEKVIFLSIAEKIEKKISIRLLVHLKKEGDQYKIERWEY